MNDVLRKFGEFTAIQAVPADFGRIHGDVIQLGVGDINEYANNWRVVSQAFTFWHKTMILGIGGFVKFWPGVAEAWSVWSTLAGEKHKKSMITAARTINNEYIHQEKLWRLHATLEGDVPESWMDHIGFKEECTLKHFSRDGSDAKIFSIITKDYLPTGVQL